MGYMRGCDGEGVGAGACDGKVQVVGEVLKQEELMGRCPCG